MRVHRKCAVLVSVARLEPQTPAIRDSITPYGETVTNSIYTKLFTVTKERNVTRKERNGRYGQQVLVCSISIS